MIPAKKSVAPANTMASLIEALRPLAPIPSAPAVLQARRNALARESFLARHGVFEVQEAVASAGYKTRNPAEQFSRWLAAGKVFAVETAGRRVLPAFQFDPISGQLRFEVVELLQIFKGYRSGWEIALWMASPNGWLDAASPIDRWPRDAARVLAAARHEVAAVGT